MRRLPTTRFPTAAMQATRPRFVLIAETESTDDGPLWRFALHGSDTPSTVAACDREAGASDDRLTLLAVVRGLEALDQPSDVTLVTRSTSVVRGVTRGLADWRNNHWRWERFGRLIPIRDADLWRRVDQALRYHRVRCRTWRFDRPIDSDQTTPALPAPHFRRRAIDADTSATHAAARLVDGRADSPAMMILPTERSRRRVRIAERSEPVAVA